MLERFINYSEIWEDKTNPQLSRTDHLTKPEINLIDVIGKQYEELTFSNWLTFYLKNPQVCKKFISECILKDSKKYQESLKKDKLFTNLKLPQREFHNIDIWLESENMVIVIENKIDSGLNGIKKTNDGFTTQLENYYNYANQKKNNRDLYCFIIKPDYSTLSTSNKYWKIINYSSIFDFFTKISQDQNFKELPYIQEFIKALKPLAQTRKTDYKDIIESRLMERITELDNSSAHNCKIKNAV
ncbi:MAG: PD-(D/E)XK nuclease family protein [Succinivibrionaceae bacterium]|nr:PD-(D/E)XK nuclease family protein [Succinivibrionaceae bacterium]